MTNAVFSTTDKDETTRAPFAETGNDAWRVRILERLSFFVNGTLKTKKEF
jgi:hypothetical protein